MKIIANSTSPIDSTRTWAGLPRAPPGILTSAIRIDPSHCVRLRKLHEITEHRVGDQKSAIRQRDAVGRPPHEADRLERRDGRTERARVHVRTEHRIEVTA